MGHKRFQLNPAKFQSLWQTCGGEMASWSPGNAPAKFAAHFATEEDRLFAKAAEGGSWALWHGWECSNKAWLQLLKSYGMNHSACMIPTRDICRTTTKFCMELHDVGFKPKKARRAAEKIKSREALDTYIYGSGMQRSRTAVLGSPTTKCSPGKCAEKINGSEHTRTEHEKLPNKRK
jgi:hypothetical protein